MFSARGWSELAFRSGAPNFWLELWGTPGTIEACFKRLFPTQAGSGSLGSSDCACWCYQHLWCRRAVSLGKPLRMGVRRLLCPMWMIYGAKALSACPLIGSGVNELPFPKDSGMTLWHESKEGEKPAVTSGILVDVDRDGRTEAILGSEGCCSNPSRSRFGRTIRRRRCGRLERIWSRSCM